MAADGRSAAIRDLVRELRGRTLCSHEAEFTCYKVTGAGAHHVDVVSGHGKTCYVFTEEYGKGNAREQRVLLWCEPGTPQQQCFPCEAAEAFAGIREKLNLDR